MPPTEEQKLVDEFIKILLENDGRITAVVVMDFFQKNKHNKEFVEAVKVWLINLMVGPGC